MAFHINKCPECKNPIGIPDNIRTMNIKFSGESQGMKILCGRMLPNKNRSFLIKCKGFIMYKPKPKI